MQEKSNRLVAIEWAIVGKYNNSKEFNIMTIYLIQKITDDFMQLLIPVTLCEGQFQRLSPPAGVSVDCDSSLHRALFCLSLARAPIILWRTSSTIIQAFRSILLPKLKSDSASSGATLLFHQL